MHHARRSARIVQPGARTAATAAKPAFNAPGKWTRTDPIPSAPSPAPLNHKTPSLPGTSKWAPRAPLNPPTQASYQGFRSSGSSGSGPSFSNGYPNRPRRDHLAGPSNASRPFGRTGPRGDATFGKVLDSLASSRRKNDRSQRDPSRLANPAQDLSGRTRTVAPHFTSNRSKRNDDRPNNSLGFLGSSARRLGNIDKIIRNGENTRGIEQPGDAQPATRSGVGMQWQPDFKGQNSSQTTAAVEEVVEEEEEVGFVSASGTSTRHTRSQKLAFKERGSLRTRVDQDWVDGTEQQTVQPKRRPVKNKFIKAANVDVYIPTIVSVNNLARLLNVRLATLQRAMRQAGMGEDTSHDHMLSSEYSSLLALEFGRNPVVDDEAAFDIHPPPVAADKSKLPLRPPVVTIMGHVDHGKTTLLDTLRSASVAKGEAGGITQHIGAFSVPVKGEVGRTITFLDTPGHAAFSAMRARGAGVTDIVVLVVAADDGVMPQTREVIELVKKDDSVGLVVAVNKVDKPGADVDKVEKALLAEGIQLEAFGGDVPSVHVSGLTGKGLDQLVETISLIAEMQDLRAEQDGPVHGFVLESKMQKGLGAVATVLLLRGAITPGNYLICGSTQAKVRLLTSPAGETVKKVLPGEAVVVSGWKELPRSGDEVLDGTEAQVKKALANRIRKAEIEATLLDVEAINSTRREERERREEELQTKRDRRGQHPGVHAEAPQEEGPKELRVLVKGDVSGSVEAVTGAIQGIGNHIARVKVVSTGVGDVTESDVMRAKASEGMIVAFSVKAPKAIESLAAGQDVSILTSSVIYRLMDDVKARVIKLLPVTIERRVRGEATVQEIFDIQLKAKKVMKVAGCRVSNGVIEKSKNARVVRNGQTVFEGRLDTFRHLKKDITEAGKGLECGISLENYSDLQAGDMIQMYEEIEIPGTL